MRKISDVSYQRICATLKYFFCIINSDMFRCYLFIYQSYTNMFLPKVQKFFLKTQLHRTLNKTNYKIDTVLLSITKTSKYMYKSMDLSFF